MNIPKLQMRLYDIRLNGILQEPVLADNPVMALRLGLEAYMDRVYPGWSFVETGFPVAECTVTEVVN